MSDAFSTPTHPLTCGAEKPNKINAGNCRDLNDPLCVWEVRESDHRWV